VPESVLVIACGALAREITELKRSHGWEHLHLATMDAWLHNRPELIAERLRAKIRRYSGEYAHVFVAYADCGTSGAIDRVLAETGATRLPGAHCYEFYAGARTFAALAASEPGSFYLTDFLAAHFERFVIRPLQLDIHPELRDAYFGNYRRVVYLSQRRSPELARAARQAAQRLGLGFEHVHCGYGELESGLQNFMAAESNG